MVKTTTRFQGAARMISPPDFYQVLQVAPNADTEMIEFAYRRLAGKWHPEKHPDDPFAFERVKLLNRAYETLSVPEKRREYDVRRREINKGEGGIAPPRGTVPEPQLDVCQVPDRVTPAVPLLLTAPPRITVPGNLNNAWWQPFAIAFGGGLTVLTLIYGTPKQIVSVTTIYIVAAFFALNDWLDRRKTAEPDPAPSTGTSEPPVSEPSTPTGPETKGPASTETFAERNMGVVVALGVLCVIVVGIVWYENSSPAWTKEEKENAAHFFVAEKAMQEAYITAQRYVNLNMAHQGLTESDTRRVVGHLKVALAEAKSVTTEVLAKAHPNSTARH